MYTDSSSKLRKLQLPETIFILGYGAIGKGFTEVILNNFPHANLKVLDLYDLPKLDTRFQYIKLNVDKDNHHEIEQYLKEGDILIDLSTNIDVMATWPMCVEKGVMYMNTSIEEWEDSENPKSFPKDLEEMYKTSLGYRHEQMESSELWDSDKGTTTVFEHGMNPGLISHFVKKGLLEAADYFLTRRDWTDVDHDLIRKNLNEKNYSKLAQAMGLHTIHCSELDDQYVETPPKDLKEKFYNTWSCRGFLTEGMVPFQVAQGSHEDKDSDEFPRLKDNSLIMSWTPSNHFWAKSWVPNQNIEGCLIPHGEAYTIRNFLSDKETGYAPSQYYVYDFNPYAKEFINTLPKTADLQSTNPDWEVIHPMNHKLHGCDKIGALLIFKNNRGWWSGSIMDENDAKKLFDHKFGPTVLQVAGAVFSAFLWMLENPNSGNKWAEHLDSEFILKNAEKYLGQVYSEYVDLNETHIKDCFKFESFLTKKY